MSIGLTSHSAILWKQTKARVEDVLRARFDVREAGDTVEATCPWGNRLRCHAPDPDKFGPMRMGMPYVEFNVPVGTNLEGIARFYREIFGGVAGVASDERPPAGRRS